MELSVDRRRKKAVTANLIRYTGRLRRLRYVSWACLLAGLAGGALFWAIGSLVPEMYTFSIQGVVTKDVGRIISHAVTIAVLGCVFSIFSRVLLAKLVGLDLNERTDESMTITDDEAVYSFRIRIRLIWVRNVVIRIPFRAIDRFSYDSTTEKIELEGHFAYALYEDTWPDAYQGQNTAAETAQRLVIYDYFSPGLYETMNNREYNMKGRLPDENRRV